MASMKFHSGSANVNAIEGTTMKAVTKIPVMAIRWINLWIWVLVDNCEGTIGRRLWTNSGHIVGGFYANCGPSVGQVLNQL